MTDSKLTDNKMIDNKEIIKRDGWFRVKVAGDRMTAYLELEPPLGEGKWPTKADAFQLLQSEGIVYGINEAAIDQLITEGVNQTVVVAKGTPPQHGKDSEIELLFETGPIRKFFYTEDAEKVDYRDIQTVQVVQTGQVIAEKIPATKGEPGFDVFGHKIEPQAGKDKFIKLGNNAAWTGDKLKIVSKINGEPSFVNNQLNVYPVHEVKGDVNLESGNITFPGNVVIHGNVDSGFCVEAEGDITIYGNVEAAVIKAGGNLTVLGGINGQGKCNINCNGDFTSKYIENTKVDCGGSVIVKEAIMHCEVNANSQVLVKMGKGLIVGGVIRAGETIVAKNVGSKFGTVTELEVGVKPKLKIEQQELETSLVDNKEKIDKAQKAIAILGKVPHLPPERQAMYKNLLKTVTILQDQNKKLEARRKELIEEMTVLSKERSKIRVKGIIFPGVKVTIAGAVLNVLDEYKYVSLSYSEGEVIVQGY